MDSGSYGETRKKRNERLKRFGLFALVILLITVSAFGFKAIRQNKNPNDTQSSSKGEIDNSANVLVPRTEHKDLGDIESIIEYGDNGLIGAHYPVFGKTNIDAISKELVTQHIEEFKNKLASDAFDTKDYKYELSIDYEAFSAPNNMISISFDIVENSSYLAHPDSRIVTKVYDLTGDREVELGNIMNGEYLKHIARISENYFTGNETYKDGIDASLFNEGVAPSAANYSKFILKEDKIVFIFARYQLFSGNFGAPSVEIPYADLKDYIKPELFPIFTKQENPGKTDIDDDKPKVEITLPKRVVDPTKPMIALSFDDGPNKKTTIPILDMLKKYNSAATFFVLGNRVSNNADILKRMLEEGSEIGNHSYNHKELTKLSSVELMDQITKTQNAVIAATGITPKLMRPTYGSYDDNLKSNVGMPLVLWSVDPLDWKSRDAKKVTDHVLSNVKDGDIILMHDIYDSTAEAVRMLIPQLIGRGYQLVTVSELFEARSETLKEGQIYRQMRKQ
ncbi:MAG TPA: polysaccharide deacetylase family protein [Clostridia bacterium]|nr:polysaccharide deacetylase family protein [Clostridia bacterium]